MVGLGLRLLGGLALSRDGVPLTTFKSQKGLALFCYLAVTGQSHSRSALAGLLWPDIPESNARTNLRKLLSRLPASLSDYLVISRQSIGLNPDRPIWVDAVQLEAALAPRAEIEVVSQAVALYQGDFLEGFSLRDAPIFDEWAAAQRARLRQGVLGALQKLVSYYEGQGSYDLAIDYGRQILTIEPWQEETHRELMRLLALTGQRSAALAQFELCRRLLQEELDLRPAPETEALYRLIQSGELSATTRLRELHRDQLEPTMLLEREAAEEARLDQLIDQAEAPAFLTASARMPTLERQIIVNREREMARLEQALDEAMSGRGGLIFLGGEAGAGKTALADEFAYRVVNEYPELVYSFGTCDVYTGVGDPYSPFRDMLQMLTGNVESLWQAGTLSQAAAVRLWHLLPFSVQVLLDQRELLEVLIPQNDLIQRMAAYVAQDNEQRALLSALVANQETSSESERASQEGLFSALTAVLTALASRQPLLLVLDDIHWADLSSISLLNHLGRRLNDQRILIIATYRHEELALGREGEPHPLSGILSEFKRHFGDREINLDRASLVEGRVFVDAFLDTEPNRLDDEFRHQLARHTRGNPLFTVETLRDMRERGDLYLDEERRWMTRENILWDHMAAQVEGVIEKRIHRLDPELSELLSIASIEGESFTAEVVAGVKGQETREIVSLLSRELDKKHRLVKARGLKRVGSQRISRYRFRHQLIQKHLYNTLDEIEKSFLHEEVANTLETIYLGQIQEGAVQLAEHFQDAGLPEKAYAYLIQAGDRARLLNAFEEAIRHYERALAILKEAGDYARASRILMKLGLTYHGAFDYEGSRRAYDEGFALGRLATRHPESRVLPQAPHALRLNINPVWTLDPIKHTQYQVAALQKQLLSGLVTFSPELNVIPDVAQSWQIQDGGRTYIFHLRDDVRWSDGQPVTAADFAYAWRRALDPELGYPAIAPTFFDIVGAEAFHQGEGDLLGVQVLDDRTLRVELKEPTAYFLQLLANHPALPVPRHVVETHGEAWAEPDNFVGNGIFRLVSWKRHDSFILERNPGYHGRFAGNVDRVEMLISTDPETCLARYEAGELDILDLNWFSTEEADATIRKHASDYLTVAELATLFVQFDTSRPPFNDRRVRQALALGLNKERLAAVHLLGQATPASGGLAPPGMPGHVPGLSQPYDLATARRLLAEAGYPEGRSFPRIRSLVDKYWSTYLDPVLDQWVSELGLEIEREFIEFFRDWTRDQMPHIWGNAWLPDYLDPDTYFRVGLRSAFFPELVLKWRDKKYDDLLERARRLLDQKERMVLYRQAEEILAREMPIIPFIYNRGHILVQPWITNFQQGQYGDHFYFKDTIIEPH